MKKKFFKCMSLFYNILIILFFNSYCFANALYVDINGGKDYTSINSALQSAYSGQTVYVEPGVYNESLNITKNVTLIGAGPDLSFIRSSSNGINIDGNVEANIRGFWITANLIGIDYQYDSTSDHAKGSIMNCIIANCGTKGIDIAKFKYGNVEIVNNTIIMNTEEAIYMYGKFGNSIVISIINNIIAYNNDDGIHRHSYPGSAYSIPNLSISYNNIYNNSGDNYSRCESTIGGISQDPKFINMSSNFKLASSSPCKNSGNPNLLYNDPDGTRNDIGAFGGPNAPVINQAPNAPSNPKPENNSTGVSLNPQLSWNCSDPDSNDTITYDIYFGTSSNPPIVSSNQNALKYITATLQVNKIYYWKIVAKDNHGEEKTGSIWQFSTSLSDLCYSQEQYNQIIADKNSIINQKDQEISNLNLIINSMYTEEDKNEAVSNAEAAKDLIINQKDQIISNKDQIIASMFTSEQIEQAEAAKDLIINQKDQIISNKDQIIASMFTSEQIEQAEAAKDLIINQKDQIISNKDQIIASMFTSEQIEQAVSQAEAAKDVIIELKDQIISDKNQIIATMYTDEQLNEAVTQAEAAKNLIINDKNEIIFQKDTIISDLQNEISKISDLNKGYSVTLSKGWHMMSAINIEAIPVTEPEGAIDVMYEYTGSDYRLITSCEPFKGFWVKINQPCEFILQRQ